MDSIEPKNNFELFLNQPIKHSLSFLEKYLHIFLNFILLVIKNFEYLPKNEMNMVINFKKIDLPKIEMFNKIF